MPDSGPISQAPRIAAIVLARAAAAAAPIAEVTALAERVAGMVGIERAIFAFTEQGFPSLRDAIGSLRDEGFSEILLLPVLVPLEPSFKNWLSLALSRWRAYEPRSWPAIRLAEAPLATKAFAGLLDEMVESARRAAPLGLAERLPSEAAIVPTEKYLLLFCMGNSCSNAGAMACWGHYRNQQMAQNLMNAGEGANSAKTSCLGACGLAPVVKVFPEGTVYGGVDEEGIDKIIAEHLLGGRVVSDLAYPAYGSRARLRQPKTP